MKKSVFIFVIVIILLLVALIVVKCVQDGIDEPEQYQDRQPVVSSGEKTSVTVYYLTADRLYLLPLSMDIPATTEAAKTPASWSEFFSNQDIMAEFKTANDNMASFNYIPGFSAVGASMSEAAAKVATGDAKVSDIFDAAQTTSVEALKNAKLPVKE